MKVRLSRLAERDLEGIGDWIARDDPVVAGRFLADLKAAAYTIGDMPYAFPAVAGDGSGSLRKRSYRRHVIYYRIGRATVTILRIIRHSRDQATQLRKP